MQYSLLQVNELNLYKKSSSIGLDYIFDDVIIIEILQKNVEIFIKAKILVVALGID